MFDRSFRMLAPLAFAAAAAAASAHPQTSETLLLSGATIVDGRGGPAFVGDVLVVDGLIAAVGPAGALESPAGVRVEDLGGLVLAPGFVDIHNHSTDRLAGDPAARTQIAQGVTTIVVGADGGSPWPIADYLDDLDQLGDDLGRHAGGPWHGAPCGNGRRLRPPCHRDRDRRHGSTGGARHARGRVRPIERTRVRPRILLRDRGTHRARPRRRRARRILHVAHPR